MNDLMREEFEAWWASTPILKENKRTLAEKAWQASRESLVVKLPKARDYYGGSSECLEGYDIDEVVDAIEAAGVKTK